MKIPRNARHEGKSIKNRETGMSQSMKKYRKSRGRNLLAGVSAAAVATGLGNVDARAEDADHRHRLEIGLGISRLQIEAPNQTFEPFWADDWDDTHFALPLSVQNKDQDDGFGTELWFTFRPQGGPWAASGGARFGRTSMSEWAQETEGDRPEIPKYPGSTYSPTIPEFPEFVSVQAKSSEKYRIVNFEVGKDVGIGAWGEGGESHVAVGLRYAHFESHSEATLDGMPNRYDPPYRIGYPPHNTDLFEADFRAEREFEGWGPSVSWKASKRLFGSDRAGHVALDWALGGGVLFGKQETEVDYDAASRYYVWPVFGLSADRPGRNNPQSEELDAASHDRSEDVTVPFVDLDLGLSYKLEQLRVSLGYHFEEYFDAIDGGVDEQREYDRTYHGPYLRISVGLFGDEGE
jgi:hypothetical protein